MKIWEDFKKFITRGNVVDMAVGVTVAGAFTAIVTAFTKGFIAPLLSLLSKDNNLADMRIVLRQEVSHIEAGEKVIDVPEVALLWGNFAQAVIDFLIIALALFILLRIATSITKHAKKAFNEMKKDLNEEKLAAEKAKADAEAAKAAEEAAAAKAAADAAAAEAAALEEAKIKAERERLEEEMNLLREIRDLLKK
ncbi:MAG: MscL family protein [Clostridia bacterium]|nr:MscL family protein [Clostridia bacterium]